MDIQGFIPRICAMSNSLVRLLVIALAIVSVLCLALTVDYNLKARRMRRTQPVFAMATNQRAALGQLVNALGTELADYSKKNPSIEPVLKKYFTVTPNAQLGRPPQR
jgi:hypothetical protein